MSDEREKPPVNPGFNPFEQAIAQAVPDDPRSNPDAWADNVKRIRGESDEDPSSEQSTAEAQVDAMFSDWGDLSAFADGVSQEDIEKFEGFESKNPAVEIPEDPVESLGPEPEIDFASLAPTPAPENIETYQELIELLERHGLSDDDALVMLLQNIERSKEIDETIWKADLQAAGFTEHDINRVIEEFLSSGEYAEAHSFANNRINFRLVSRNQTSNAWIMEVLHRLAFEAGSGWSNSLEDNYATSLRIAGSLESYNGPSSQFNGLPQNIEEFEVRWKLISRWGAYEYQVLANTLAKFDTLGYLASQKLSIENF